MQAVLECFCRIIYSVGSSASWRMKKSDNWGRWWRHRWWSGVKGCFMVFVDFFWGFYGKLNFLTFMYFSEIILNKHETFYQKFGSWHTFPNFHRKPYYFLKFSLSKVETRNFIKNKINMKICFQDFKFPACKIEESSLQYLVWIVELHWNLI